MTLSFAPSPQTFYIYQGTSAVGPWTQFTSYTGSSVLTLTEAYFGFWWFADTSSGLSAPGPWSSNVVNY
jgi:hypothetical protein